MNKQPNLDFIEFEEILKEKKEHVKKNIGALKVELNALGNEDEIDDTLDMAELQIDNTVDQSILHQLEMEMREINAALERVREGDYGICEKTGKPIPIERLKANPLARTLIDA